MNRRTFLLGSAFLAAGCGGGNGTTTRLTYRRVDLGQGSPIGLDDLGNAYVVRPDGTTARWSKGTFTTTLPTNSFSKQIHHVRPDGTLVTMEGYFTVEGVFHPLRLPTFAELNIDAPDIIPGSMYVQDVNSRGEFVGKANHGSSAPLGPYGLGMASSHAFVMRQTGLHVLPKTYVDAGHLLESGHFIGFDRSFRISQMETPYSALVPGPDSARLFGPDNTLVDHPLNTKDIALGVLKEDLSFAGRVMLPYNLNQDYMAAGNQSGLTPDSRKLAGPINNVLIAPTGEFLMPLRGLSDSELESSWHVVLPDNTEIDLTNFVPSSLAQPVAVAFNARREILATEGHNIGNAFLLTPI